MAAGMSRGLNCANCTCETRGAVPLTRPSATLACAASPRCKAPPNSAKAKTDLRTIDRGPPIRAPDRGRTGESDGSPPDITWNSTGCRPNSAAKCKIPPPHADTVSIYLKTPCSAVIFAATYAAKYGRRYDDGYRSRRGERPFRHHSYDIKTRIVRRIDRKSRGGIQPLGPDMHLSLRGGRAVAQGSMPLSVG